MRRGKGEPSVPMVLSEKKSLFNVDEITCQSTLTYLFFSVDYTKTES